MVKITNGTNVFEVTNGAFEGIYRHQGYRKMDAGVTETHVEPAAPVKTEDELFVEEIVEKPIAGWNKDEVKRFAAIKEISLTGTKNADEAKAIIKEFLEANAED